MIRSDTNDSNTTIELTPIIDMVFLLLIFFLVATTFHQTEREMQIALPSAASAGPITAAMRELIINVDRDGRIVVAGAVIEPEQLRTIIQDAVEQNPEQKVSVRGDRNTIYNNVTDVLDICKAAGIQQPYLDLVPAD
ncbi:MAG: ExbD/TolR family protein [Phycisphaerales bacterium]